MKTNCQMHETDIIKACESAIELSEKATSVVAWYPYNNHVRGPFCRWIHIGEV